MAITKGAERRHAYLTVVLGSVFVAALAFGPPHNWITVVAGIGVSTVVGNRLRKLADVGFTARADNEK